MSAFAGPSNLIKRLLKQLLGEWEGAKMGDGATGNGMLDAFSEFLGRLKELVKQQVEVVWEEG